MCILIMLFVIFLDIKLLWCYMTNLLCNVTISAGSTDHVEMSLGKAIQGPSLVMMKSVWHGEE